jgi:hypothetical protein
MRRSIAQEHTHTGIWERARAWLATRDQAWLWALKLFLGYRLLFTIWGAWVSSVFPKSPIEATIGLWPTGVSLGAWLERILVWPTVRYDAYWYMGIAAQGYAYREGSTAFHPLYPLLMAIVGRVLGGNYALAGWLIAQVCCVCMLAVLYKLVLLDYDVAIAQRTTVFLIGSPLGFSFLLPYTESLLLLCVVGALYAARRGRWVLAGLAGAGAALTKQPGVVVMLPLLWELWQQQRDNLRARKWHPLLLPLVGIALVPLGLLSYLVYRASLGDASFSLSNPFSLIDSLLVTPSYRDTWGEYFSWPWENLLLAIEQIRARPYFYLVFNTYLMAVAVVMVIYTIFRARRSYAIYSLVLLLMNLSIVYPLWPYMGILRRFTIIFPLFIQLAIWGRSRWVTPIILSVNALLWVYISEAYMRLAFVP